MKKYTFILIFVLSFINVGLIAQNNGFLGKRVLFNMDVKVTPTFTAPTNFGSYDIVSFDFTFSPNIECIIYKKGIAGLAFNYLSTQYQFDHRILPVQFSGGGIFYKQYLNRSSDYYQAPFGVYTAFRFDYLKYNCKTPDYYDYSGTLFGFRAEIGVDYLLWNRVRLSWGLSVGFTNKGVLSFLNIGNYYPLSFVSAIEDRMATNYLYHNKIGIGILLF